MPAEGAAASFQYMKTLEDIQLAISVLPAREWQDVNRWIGLQAMPYRAMVREAPAAYGSSPAITAIQAAVRRLDSEQLRELCDWLQPGQGEPEEGWQGDVPDDDSWRESAQLLDEDYLREDA